MFSNLSSLPLSQLQGVTSKDRAILKMRGVNFKYPTAENRILNEVNLQVCALAACFHFTVFLQMQFTMLLLSMLMYKASKTTKLITTYRYCRCR